MESNTDRISTLRKQLDYYLSDKNLEGDKFFYDSIKADVDGYIDISLFLNCKKVKEINATKSDLTDAIKISHDLELDPSNTERVRRKDNKPLPEFSLLNKKKQRKDSDHSDDQEKAVNSVILEIVSNKDTEIRWKKIQDHFNLINTHLNAPYMRFKVNSGHIGVFHNSDGEIKFNDKFELEGVEFTVTKCEGDSLIDFYKNHGSHFEMCTGRQKKNDSKGKKQRDLNTLKNKVKLGNETFTDINKIKSRVRNIFASFKDDEHITGDDSDFLLDLLKSHRNFEEKSKDLDHFTIGKPSEHVYSRCFFIVRKDNTKDDFSTYKCIERIQNDNKRKTK